MSKLMYQPQSIEAKWQQFWEETQLFQDTAKSATELPDAEKLYLLFAFAYPSGSGLHVGHVESKTALDILARYYRMKGKNVFFPVGWDAFGLPAENYAIKTGIHPATTTKNAIDTFRRQIKRLGISYDWANEIATNHPEYYKWTQWLFLQLYKKGLAYRGIGMVNWCPKDQTVLANEQVVNGECERCGTKVVQKELEQWYFKITQYQEELLTGLDEVDWPLPTKEQQRHWIGKKEGMEITFELSGQNEHIVCFTTRPDTNYGATFVVLAPEHKLSKMIADGDLELSADIRQKVTTYIEASQTKTELERQSEGKKKTGVFTGLYVTNKLSGKKLPVWISDFVLGGFGTGAVMGVPGHDRRDFEFAQAMGIEIIRVVKGADGDESEITKLSQVIEDQGTMVNSEALNGLTTQEALKKVASLLEEKGIGKRVTTYRLRDWLISRQRYWGAPIPIVYDPEGKPHMVKEEHLPWTLPTDVDFNPTGESPLKSSKEFIERTEKLYGKGWRPEFDTMDTFVDSSWYFLRYVSSRDSDDFANKEQLNYWLPVDLYMIGPEHIVLHLLYSRFFTKFLRDEGYLNFNEPFMKMRHQGMILGPDGKKMSKSKGNVINPDEVVEKYGADTLRMYEMFMGPIESDKPWNVNAVTGVYRFLTRVNSVVLETTAGTKSSETTELRRKLHQTLQKVSDDIPKLKFNTAIAAMMELINVWESTLAAKQPTGLTAEEVLSFVKMLAPFAPFMAEELYHQVVTSKEADSVHLTKWPQWDEALAQSDIKQIPVQVNGKVRALLSVTMAEVEDKEAILSAAKELPTIATRLEGNTVLKELYVPGRIINFVVQEQ